MPPLILPILALVGCSSNNIEREVEILADVCSDPLPVTVVTDDEDTNDVVYGRIDEVTGLIADQKSSFICGLDSFYFEVTNSDDYYAYLGGGGVYTPAGILDKKRSIAVVLHQDMVEPLLDPNATETDYEDTQTMVDMTMAHEFCHYATDVAYSPVLDTFAKLTYTRKENCSRSNPVDELHDCWVLNDDAVANDFVGNTSYIFFHDTNAEVKGIEGGGNDFPIPMVYGSNNMAENSAQACVTVFLDQTGLMSVNLVDGYSYTQNAETGYALMQEYWGYN